MTRRRKRSPTIAVEVGRRSAWLRGTGLVKVLHEVGVPRMWCPFHRCITVPVDRLDDVLAVIEFRDRRPVDLQAVDR